MYTDEMTEEDREKLNYWMDEIARGSGVEGAFFPSALLPKTGLAVRNGEGRTLAVGTLYLEKSSTISVFGFCCADPENTKRESAEAVKLLISAMPVYAKRCGAEYLLSMFGRRSLNRLLDRSGYIFGEKSETKFRRL